MPVSPTSNPNSRSTSGLIRSDFNWGQQAPGSSPVARASGRSALQREWGDETAQLATGSHQLGQRRWIQLELARRLAGEVLELADEVRLIVKGITHHKIGRAHV